MRWRAALSRLGEFFPRHTTAFCEHELNLSVRFHRDHQPEGSTVGVREGHGCFVPSVQVTRQASLPAAVSDVDDKPYRHSRRKLVELRGGSARPADVVRADSDQSGCCLGSASPCGFQPARVAPVAVRKRIPRAQSSCSNPVDRREILHLSARDELVVERPELSGPQLQCEFVRAAIASCHWCHSPIIERSCHASGRAPIRDLEIQSHADSWVNEFPDDPRIVVAVANGMVAISC